MNDIKTILQLHHGGFSQREIASKVKKSHNTVSDVIKEATDHGLSLYRIIDLQEDELTALLFPERKLVPVYKQPDFEHCHKELMESHTNKKSTIFCSQWTPEGWYERLGSGPVAESILDRIVNSSYEIDLQGNSFREDYSRLSRKNNRAGRLS